MPPRLINPKVVVDAVTVAAPEAVSTRTLMDERRRSAEGAARSRGVHEQVPYHDGDDE